MAACEKIGEFDCPWGDHEGDVRRDKTGKMFLLCACGQHFLRSAAGQDAILRKARIYGAAEPAPAVTPVTPKKRSAPAQPADAPAKSEPEKKKDSGLGLFR